MFDSPREPAAGTGRRPILDEWEDEPDSTPGGNGKPKGTAPVTAQPRQKRTLPNRLPDSITLAELRALCSDTDYPEDKRLALLLVSMWLSRQPTKNTESRRTAATLGTDVCRGAKSAEQLAQQCFPDETVEMVIEKAKALLMICVARLVPEVKDLAMSHVSSKCGFTAEHVAIANSYAQLLASKRPNVTVFNATNTVETWWPDFP